MHRAAMLKEGILVQGGGACEFDCVFLVKQIFRLMVRLQVKQKTS